MKCGQDHWDNHTTSVLFPFHVCTFWFPLEYEMKVSPAAQTTSHHITKSLPQRLMFKLYIVFHTHMHLFGLNKHLANCESS